MKLVEINPSGNFDPWSIEKQKELENLNPNEPLGTSLLFENESMRLWNIYLEPGERLPFRIQRTNYNWICMTGGLAISRFNDGKICLVKFDKEDVDYWEFQNNELICDLENIGEEEISINLIEYLPTLKTFEIPKYL
ncbi:hypothetical protein GGR42_001085 [Saonia flava]|uniref:Uncharacterized protein n=1 Tax=Saonia flava TaxID=523696 RepID=A0A846QWH1_9FLAO|nr:hypothetical protein [Saonia flava]NJB70623.1 hypothetical protein [Saonia flava]